MRYFVYGNFSFIGFAWAETDFESYIAIRENISEGEMVVAIADPNVKISLKEEIFLGIAYSNGKTPEPFWGI